MPVEEALRFFEHIPKIRRRLETLDAVGLGYVRLGQPATTLSGGEAQRVKLASELSKIATGRTLYILDEPTTGLHFADVERLLEVLQRLVDAGNSVVVIEHNLGSGDQVRRPGLIDMWPGGGRGGRPGDRGRHAGGGRRRARLALPGAFLLRSSSRPRAPGSANGGKQARKRPPEGRRLGRDTARSRARRGCGCRSGVGISATRCPWEQGR